MNIIDRLTSLLENEKILPVSKETWSVFKLNHCRPQNEQIKKEQYSFIRGQVEKTAGIYIYMKNDNCLYIGKAKLLYDRIKSHYIESFSPVPGDTKDMRWHRFFSQHQGELEVYWKEFQNEEERQIIELLLTKLLQPTFLGFK
ncbi:MAG TPA: GIY-YIG nuclease family protein [Patescibacteria group bacterium]|nr:GIY-YIG nuclease family protein [Patescibacteria group bacterium]